MRARWHTLLMLLLALSAAGCVDNPPSSDSDKPGGFYGGISGAGTWP